MMTDTPPNSAEPEPEQPAPAVECKKCQGKPGALRHAKGCPNVTPEARERQERKMRNQSQARTRTAPKSTGGKVRYAPALTQYAGTLGTMLTMAGHAKGSAAMAYDGQVILTGAESWALTVEQLAYEDERVARVLDSMLSTSAWGAVMVSTASIVVPILACHGLLPPATATIFGAPAPPRPEPEWRDDAAEATVPPTDHDTWQGNGAGTASHAVPLN